MGNMEIWNPISLQSLPVNLFIILFLKAYDIPQMKEVWFDNFSLNYFLRYILGPFWKSFRLFWIDLIYQSCALETPIELNH